MLRKLLIPKRFIILTFVFVFIIVLLFSFSYIMYNKENLYLSVCKFLHMNPELQNTYALIVVFGFMLLSVIFGTAVKSEFFMHTTSLGAGGSWVFVLFFYMFKLFINIIYGSVCLLVFFVLSIYSIIFSLVTHEPLD